MRKNVITSGPPRAFKKTCLTWKLLLPLDVSFSVFKCHYSMISLIENENGIETNCRVQSDSSKFFYFDKELHLFLILFFSSSKLPRWSHCHYGKKWKNRVHARVRNYAAACDAKLPWKKKQQNHKSSYMIGFLLHSWENYFQIKWSRWCVSGGLFALIVITPNFVDLSWMISRILCIRKRQSCLV